MSIITIHCRLTASEPVRRHLWHLMAERNTPLINELLTHVSQHPDFETWQRKGNIPARVVKDLCKPLRAIYSNQPGRFYASAILMVTYIYESWLALQKKRRFRLDGKQRWLNVVRSDAELVEMSGSNMDAIRRQAQAILNQFNATPETQSAPKAKKRKTNKLNANNFSNKSLLTHLFEVYDATDDILNRCVIAYLIKNGCKIPDSEEIPEKFAHRIHRKRKEVERLEDQLKARLPKGRDLTGKEFLGTLEIVTQQIPESVSQQREWEAKLLTHPATLPYPIIYGSSTDVRWSKTEKGRIAVSFNGVDKYLKAADPNIEKWFKTAKEHPFRLYCDQRKLTFFQRFFEDYQAFTAIKETYPESLLTLRSAMLGWREGNGKGEPWNVHHLALYCSFDTRLMTAEGTLQVQKEKITKAKEIAKNKNKKDGSVDAPKRKLSDGQEKHYQRNASSLNRLRNVPPRPSRKPYLGNPEILVGLSIGLAAPITASVINGKTGNVLTYRTPQTLLREQYRLLNRHRQQQQQNRLQRHKNQKRGVTYQPSESDLREYVDRLLAKSIIQLAQTYQAGSIVIPNLKNLQELLASEIKAKAEQACPGSVEAQDKYAKQYQMSIHQWSYNRLIEAIHNKAQQIGIRVESGFQPGQGTAQDKAKEIAIAAYHLRTTATH